MAIKELSSGQSHSFSPTALRVTLTGSTTGQAARLRVVDQSGADSIAHRLGTAEVVLTPQPRRVRLMAVPDLGGAFQPGTRLGLTLRTEGASTATEQVLVAAVDVGALAECEFAVLEFAQTRAVLTVSRVGDTSVPTPGSTQPTITSGQVFSAATATPSGNPPKQATENVAWLETGRYALRDAAKMGTVGTPSPAWGVVLDGSSSMRSLHRSGQLEGLVSLVLGSLVVGAHTWPQAISVAGVRQIDVSPSSVTPESLLDQAFSSVEPASWAAIGRVAQRVVDQVGTPGTVVVLTDGVPGDLANLIAVAKTHPAVRVVLVTTGISRYGLASDGVPQWWEEGLGGLEETESIANFEVISTRLTSEGRIDLSGSRAAELALRLTSERAVEATL